MKTIVITGSTRGIGYGLAEKVMANDRTGARFKWLSTSKLLGRFLAAPFRKRDLFD